MPLELSEGIFIVEKSGREEAFVLRVRSSVKERQRLHVVNIRYVRTPDADSKLSRAIDILLGSAVRELEGNINAKKEEKPPRNNRLTKAMERKK